MNDKYNKEATELLHTQIFETLGRIEKQTTRTNGRVSRLERWLLILGSITLTLLVINGSSFINLLSSMFI